MGEYTENLKLYKPDPTEFIDVDVQLNRNWDIVDKDIKQLLEWEYSTETSPNITDSKSRSKFFKSYSNSLQMYFKSGNFFWQGPSNPVMPWVSGSSWLNTGWSEHSDSKLFVRRNERKSPATKVEIEWVGAIWTGGTLIPANTNFTLMTAGSIPETYRPGKSCYFTMWAGNTSSNYSFYRLFIGSNGSMLARRIGSDPSSSEENRLELVGVKYDPAVTT